MTHQYIQSGVGQFLTREDFLCKRDISEEICARKRKMGVWSAEGNLGCYAVEGEVKERGVTGRSGSVGGIKFIRSPISCFIARGWEPTDGADKPENFSSIAGSFNIAPSGTSLNQL